MSNESPQQVHRERNPVSLHWKTLGATSFLCAFLGCVSVWLGAVYQNGQNVNTLNFHMDGLIIKYDFVESKRHSAENSSEGNPSPNREKVKNLEGPLKECQQDLLDKKAELAKCLKAEPVLIEPVDRTCCYMRNATDTMGVTHIGWIFYDPESTIHLVINKWNNGIVTGNLGSRNQELQVFDNHNATAPFLIRGAEADYQVSVFNYEPLGNGQGKFRVSVKRF